MPHPLLRNQGVAEGELVSAGLLSNPEIAVKRFSESPEHDYPGLGESRRQPSCLSDQESGTLLPRLPREVERIIFGDYVILLSTGERILDIYFVER